MALGVRLCPGRAEALPTAGLANAERAEWDRVNPPTRIHPAQFDYVAEDLALG